MSNRSVTALAKSLQLIPNTRSRIPISVRFALRSPKRGQTYSNPHPLQVWITVNGKRIHFGAVWPLNDPTQRIMVDPSKWSVERQCTSTRNDPANEALIALKAYILAVHRQQTLITAPTINSVYIQLLTNKTPDFIEGEGWITDRERLGTTQPVSAESRLRQAYATYMNKIRAQKGASLKHSDQIAIGRWERGLFLLTEWERQRGQPTPSCRRVTLAWLKEYHSWLQTQKSDKQALPISEAMASRYIGKVGQVLQWMVEDELLPHNNVKKCAWPRYGNKKVLFLEAEHVNKLFTLSWKGTKGHALWWFLLMCCTGLDYPDAVAYALNRKAYEVENESGLKLVGRRKKPPHNEYHLPLLGEVERLFTVYPTGAKVLANGVVNRYTDAISDELGINWRITAKTARKTFGNLMLAAGHRVADVSLMLGHAAISITERHYVKVRGASIDRSMKRVKITISELAGKQINREGLSHE